MADVRAVLVLQHIACEPPALYEDVLRERDIALTRVEVDEGEPVPDPLGFDAVVVMGGPMGAYDVDAYPWLRTEKAALRTALRDDVPIWGVCLGAQLLAAALGAAVYRGARPEVGVCQVSTTEAAADDPVFGVAPARFVALQWHSDTFDLPDGATSLAGSDAYPHQAFAHGRAYGLQFHLEVTPGLVAEWAKVPAYEASLAEVEGPGAFPRLATAVTGHIDATGALARRLFTRWLDVVAG